MEKFHIGNAICEKLENEGRTKKWLAKKVWCEPSNLGKILKSGRMNTDLLIAISHSLKHNFFRDFDVCFPEQDKWL